MRILRIQKFYSPIDGSGSIGYSHDRCPHAYAATQLTVSSEGTCVFGILDAPDTVGLCGNASLQAVMNTLCPPNNNYTDNRMYVVDMPTTDVPWIVQ